MSKTRYCHAGSYLQELRLKHDFTQAELAKKVSAKIPVHSQFVSNWERGLCMPPSHAMATLIKVLKVDKETLVAKMLQDSEMEIRSSVFKRAS